MEYLPAAQGVQVAELVCPVAAEYLPAAQGGQIVDAFRSEYVPSGHGVQKVADRLEYLPGTHDVHEVAPSRLLLPAEQLPHAALAMPAWPVLLNVPGAHLGGQPHVKVFCPIGFSELQHL